MPGKSLTFLLRPGVYGPMNLKPEVSGSTDIVSPGKIIYDDMTINEA
jgi:hypothetical protein